jgi:hypothetical protein
MEENNIKDVHKKEFKELCFAFPEFNTDQLIDY